MADESIQQLSSPEANALIERYQASGDSQALDSLVNEFLPLVKYLARRFKRDGVALDDLIQVGSIGLLKALKRFDISSDVKFVTYVTPTIIGEIKHYFRDKQWSVQVPRRIKEISNKIYNSMPILTQQLQKMPNPKEMAEYLGISEEEVIKALEWGQAYQTASLDSVISSAEDDNDITLLNALGKEDVEIRKIEELSELNNILEVLSAEERQILQLRYEEELTQQEIGNKMGLSQMQVSRMLRKIIKRLKGRREELDA